MAIEPKKQLARELRDANFRFNQKIVELGDRQQRLRKDQGLRRPLCNKGTVHLGHRQLPTEFGAEHLSATANGDERIICVFDKETLDGVVEFGDLDGRILELEVIREAGAGFLVASVYINNMGDEQIAKAVDELLDEGTNRFVFDLEQCRIVNSIDISILIEVIEKVLKTEGRVLFCAVSPTITKTFRIMGLLQISDICDTRAQALAAG